MTTQIASLQPTGGNLKAALSQSGRRWILSAVTLVVLAASAGGIALAVAASRTAVEPSAALIIQPGSANTTPVLFGCSGELVIANVDCDLGVATAFDAVEPVIYQPQQNQPLIHIPDLEQAAGLAPWCDGRPDQTIYGCTITCQDATAVPVVDQATQAQEDQCAYDVWIDDILLRLEAGSARAHTCLTMAKPLPACIP